RLRRGERHAAERLPVAEGSEHAGGQGRAVQWQRLAAAPGPADVQRAARRRPARRLSGAPKGAGAGCTSHRFGSLATAGRSSFTPTELRPRQTTENITFL